MNHGFIFVLQLDCMQALLKKDTTTSCLICKFIKCAYYACLKGVCMQKKALIFKLLMQYEILPLIQNHRDQIRLNEEEI